MKKYTIFTVTVWIVSLTSMLVAQPTIQQVYAPAQMRVMDAASLAVAADAAGDERALEYHWSIVSAPEVTAPVLYFADDHTCVLELWWLSASTAEQAVGGKVSVQVEVSYAGADPDLEPPTVVPVDISIYAVNHPPVPIIAGNLGSLTARIPTPAAIGLTSHSTDPDGDSPRVDWGLDEYPSGPGSYRLGDPTMYGTNGTSPSVAVTQATTGDINQGVILRLTDGLHVVTTTDTIYLTGASSQTTTNRVPVLTVNHDTLNVTQGQNAIVQATAVDQDGDDLAFTWLMGSTSVSTSYLTTARNNSTTFTSALQYPTSNLSPGSYTITVRAFESTTSDGYSTQTKSILLNVYAQGTGGDPGYFDVSQGTCGSNSGPTLLSIQPDPQTSAITLQSGQTASVELIFQDYSSTQKSFQGVTTTVTGIDSATWDLSQLTARGISIQDPPQLPTGIAQQGRFVLTFPVPSGQTGDSQVVVTASDVLGCTTTVGFGLSFSTASANQAPVARIQFDQDGDGNLSGPFASGYQLQTTSRSIHLNAGASTDEGDQTPTFTWSANGLNATLSASSGVDTTLSVPGTGVGNVTVVLTATDSGGLWSTSTVVFQIANDGSSPIAKILYDDGAGSSGPFSSGHIVNPQRRTISLDGSSSTDDQTQQLVYLWALSGVAGPTLSSTDTATTTLTVPSGTVGTVVVSLTVTDEQNLSDTSILNFAYTSSGDPPSAEITSYPDSVTVGEEFEVQGEGTSNGGSGDLAYIWEARCCGAEAWSPMFEDGTRARMTPPNLDAGTAEGDLEVRLTVKEGGLASDPDTKVLHLGPSEKYFAQLAVGTFGQPGQRFETSIVLINDQDVPAEGQLTFFTEGEDGVEEEWPVTVVDRSGNPLTDGQFDLPNLGAAEYLVTGEEVLKSGWMKLSSNVKLDGHLFYRVVEKNQTTGAEQVMFEVPILPVYGKTLRTSLSPGTNQDLALALVNAGDSPLVIKMMADDATGAATQKTITLEPHQRVAKFLYEFSGPQLPWVGYTGGTLTLQVQGDGKFAATILKTRDGFPLSILPLAAK